MSQSIMNLFASSPLKPLQQHMHIAYDCTSQLPEFIQALCEKNWDQAAEIHNAIIRLEHRADHLKIDFRTGLPRRLFLPVPRYELLELISKQDDIANLTKDIAGIIFGRKMVIPDELKPSFTEYLTSSISAVKQANQVIHELDELLETGFKGKEVSYVENMVKELNRIEGQNDQIQIELRDALFSIEKSLSPIDAMFLYKIIDKIGDLADCAQKVGARLMMLTANS